VQQAQAHAQAKLAALAASSRERAATERADTMAAAAATAAGGSEDKLRRVMEAAKLGGYVEELQANGKVSDPTQ
jgi:hypothetical protein